jgi:hypothetical protein
MYTLTDGTTTYVAYIDPTTNKLNVVTSTKFNSLSFASPASDIPKISEMKIDVVELNAQDISKYNQATQQSGDESEE